MSRPAPAAVRSHVQVVGDAEEGLATPGLGDEQGLSAAYAAYGAELYRFVLRGLGDAGAAQDVVRETFLRAWRAADRFDPALASLRVWLFAIARNAMVDSARAARARPWQGTLLDPRRSSARAPPSRTTPSAW